MEDDGVPGCVIGPALEWLTYLTDDEWQAEYNEFWSIVAALFRSYPGKYEDLPEAFREPGTDALLSN